MSSINFDNAWLLLIAVPVIILLVIPFFIAINKDNRNWHNVASTALHIFIALCVAFSAAGTTVETVITQTDVYVLADVSYSSHRNFDLIDEYIDDLNDNLPNNSKLGIVCFGEDQEVLTLAGGKIRSVSEATVDDSATNIADALSYVGKIFRSNVIKRVVLITDGKQTDQMDSGELKRAVSELNAKNIRVDAIYLDNNVKAGESEAQITSVDYAKTVYLNRKSVATAQISSKYQTSANVFLYQGEQLIATEPVTLKSGRTYVEFELPTSASGEFNYQIKLEAEGDKNPHDNVGYFTQKVQPVVKVLVLTGLRSDATAFVNAFGDDAEVDTYLLNEYNEYTGPYTVSGLCQYDEIVLSNVNLALMRSCDMFVDSLISVVNDLGKSLVTAGNLYIQAQKDDAATETEGEEGEEPTVNLQTQSAMSRFADKLPVDYANSVRETKLITFVFDASDSMFTNGKLLRAQDAARQIVKSTILSEDDKVAMVTFHGDKATKLVVTDMTADGREKAIQAIDDISVKQGTMMSGGLEQAYIEIAGLNNLERQVILMSDGLNSSSDPDDDLYAWAESLGAIPGVAVSVIDVGRGPDDKWDEKWVEAGNRLREIARLGGGEYMYADSADVMEDFILPEIADDIANVVVDGQMTKVNVKISKADVLSGIDVDNIPYINGYINTGMKYSANNVLTADHKLTSSTNIEVPIYAYWKVGKGTVSSFTSNVTSNPIGDSADVDGYWLSQWNNIGITDVFLKNILYSNTPVERNDSPFSFTLMAETGFCSFTVVPVEVKSEATVRVTVTAPDGSTFDVGNIVFDSSVYTGSFSTLDQGDYKLDVTYSYKGVDSKYTTHTYVSYLPEYDSFALYEASPLYKMLGGNGVVSEDGNLKIEQDENSVERQIVRLAPVLLIISAIMFVIDIIIRKLKWEDIRSLFKKINKEKK